MIKPSARAALAAIVFLLATSLGWAQMPGNSGAAASPAPPETAGAAPDAALSDLLTQLQTSAQQSDSDLSRLRIEKWKADAANKRQAQDNASAIHRNLANAVPELLQKVRSEPDSLSANFKLYWDLNAIYDAFTPLVESAGAFGPDEQYSPLAGDLARLDQLRHRLAERLDRMTEASDAELRRLRARSASAAAAVPETNVPAVTRIVVDDNHPAERKRKKKPKPKSPPPSPQH